MKFLVRDEELQACLEAFEGISTQEAGDRIVVVTGDSGVGKTALIQKALQKQDLPYVRVQFDERYSTSEVAALLAAEIRQRFDLSEEAFPTESTLEDVVGNARRLSIEEPFIIVIDGITHFAALERFFPKGNRRAKTHLGLVLVGVDEDEGVALLRERPGKNFLHIDLKPFTTAQLRRVHGRLAKKATPEDLLMFYALTGGVPRLVSFLADESEVTAEGLFKYLFAKRGEGYRAMAELRLTRALGAAGALYWRLLEVAAMEPVEWDQFERVAEGGQLSPYVERLENRYGLLKRPEVLLAKQRRGVRYVVEDAQLRTWLTFVAPLELRTRIEAGDAAGAVVRARLRRERFLRWALVKWFKASRRERETVSGTLLGEWRGRGTVGVIDLAVFDAERNRFELSEINLHVGSARPEQLEERAKIFLREVKALKNPAFSAAIEVAPILQSLTLEDL